MRDAAVLGEDEDAQENFLIAYGTSLREGYRGMTAYVDKVLKGANPWRPAVGNGQLLRADREPEDGSGDWCHDSPRCAQTSGPAHTVILGPNISHSGLHGLGKRSQLASGVLFTGFLSLIIDLRGAGSFQLRSKAADMGTRFGNLP